MEIFNKFCVALASALVVSGSFAQTHKLDKLRKVYQSDKRVIFIDPNTFFTTTYDNKPFSVAKFMMLVKDPVIVDEKPAHIFTAMIAAECGTNNVYTYNNFVYGSSSDLIKTIPEMEKYDAKDAGGGTSLIAVSYKVLCETQKETPENAAPSEIKKRSQKLNEQHV